MNGTQWNVIRGILIESCTGLFNSAKFPIRLRGEANKQAHGADGVSVAITLTSAQIVGCIGVTMPFPVLSRSHPLCQNRTPTEREMLDWACEMTNQLAGRVKHRLSAHGISFRMGSPMVLAGGEMRLPDESLEGARQVMEFSSGGQSVLVHFAARITPGATFQEAPESDEKDAAEGSIVLFEAERS